MIFSSGPFSSVIRNNPIARPDAAAGEGRIAGKDERVERVAVAAKPPFDKAVVGGIAGRREQPPVEEDRAGRLVQLVLVARARRNLDVHDNVASPGRTGRHATTLTGASPGVAVAGGSDRALCGSGLEVPGRMVLDETAEGQGREKIS
jgi:hypothetical protein